MVGAVTSAGRDRVAMRPPPVDLADFPRKTIDGGRRWWRNHGARGPWYFASGDGGRFNLEHPRGTLYLASSAECAARERIGFDLVEAGIVPASEVADRFVSELTLPIDIDAAWTTTVDGMRWGVVSLELATVDEYPLTRAWAAGFAAAGFTGMWTLLRFSGTHGRGLAVFGDEGARTWAAPADPIALRELAETTMRLTVLDPPSSRALTVLTTPPPS